MKDKAKEIIITTKGERVFLGPISSPTAQEHQKNQHEKCQKCHKQMCFYYPSGGIWVCFTPGICEKCYMQDDNK